MNLIQEQPDENISVAALFYPLALIEANLVTEKITGYCDSGLINSDISNYFTEPQKARQTYKEISDKALITSYSLARRHKAGFLMAALYNASVYRSYFGKTAGVL